MQGRRVYPDEQENLSLAEGDYGFDPKIGHWVVRPPGCHAGGIPDHQVTEHEDETVTVSPSILLWDSGKDGIMMSRHGYLEHGVWRKV